MPDLRLTRVPVRIPATYYLKGIEAKGTSVDISSGGVGLEAKQIFVQGDIIRVVFMGHDGKMIDFWGIVMNVGQNAIGIRYEEISNDMREAIDDFVTALIRKHGLTAKEPFPA
jgi:c-di-GMP-binding flagellar brake protein YcgR